MEIVQQLLLVVPVVLLAVVAHEYAHARVALWQGDPTAASLGRVTLNPIPHIDPWGTILIPALLWLLPGGFIFGWAKPVPIDPRRFRDPRRGDMLVSVAGVAANFALAIVFTIIAMAAQRLTGVFGPTGAGIAAAVVFAARIGIFINLLLAVFNLIPVPPLDGSHLLYHLLPPHLGKRYRELGRFSPLLLFAVLLVPELLTALLSPVRVLMRGADALIGVPA